MHKSFMNGGVNTQKAKEDQILYSKDVPTIMGEQLQQFNHCSHPKMKRYEIEQISDSIMVSVSDEMNPMELYFLDIDSAKFGQLRKE